LALVSTDGKKIDPFYLGIFKENTLVLVVSKPLWDAQAPQYPTTQYPAPPGSPGSP